MGTSAEQGQLAWERSAITKTLTEDSSLVEKLSEILRPIKYNLFFLKKMKF